MIERYSVQVWRACRLADFLWRSGTRYRIHSPFLYSLIDGVIINGKREPGLDRIESIREKCRNSREIILKTDFGKGAGEAGQAVYPVRVSTLARSSVTARKHALRLHLLVKYTRSGNILELGTSLGLTTAYLALQDGPARVISLEGCPELSRLAESNLADAGAADVEILTGRFEDRIGEALEKLGQVDLVYLDGDHRKSAVLANFERCRPFLHNDSVFVIDDIHSSPGMEEAWEELIRRKDVTISLDFYHWGWLFFRKESSKEHFRLRYL